MMSVIGVHVTGIEKIGKNHWRNRVRFRGNISDASSTRLFATKLFEKRPILSPENRRKRRSKIPKLQSDHPSERGECLDSGGACKEGNQDRKLDDTNDRNLHQPSNCSNGDRERDWRKEEDEQKTRVVCF
ncbi:hypothetical protein TB2_037372 [Malus domestica]